MSNIDRSTAATGTGANIVTPPAVAPVAAGMQNLSLGEKLVHEPERVIQHAPLFEKEVLRENTLGVQREHHIQPVVHETEHLIQPIIKTQATAERPILEQDKNVMHAPIVQPAVLPAGLEAVDRVAPEGIVHRPKYAKDVVVEKPVQVKHEHHVQPIIHEREHHIQPIVKTDVTAEQRLLETERNVVLPPIVEAPVMVGTRPSLGATAQAPILPTGGQPVATTATTTIPRTAGLAQAPLPAPHVTKGATNLGGAPLGGANAGMLDTEERLPSAAGIVAPELPGETEVYNKDLGAGKGVGTTASDTTTGHATIGQKLKGALKEVTGTITRNPAKKEEGKMLMHGVDPASGTTTGL